MIVHLNGALVEAAEAKVSIFDRGFLFGDGVYEGLRSVPGPDGAPVIIGSRLHEQRMREGLAEARITGFDPAALGTLTAELVRANSLPDAFVYWQVSRGTPPGAAGPDRPRVPTSRFPPTVVGFATPVPPLSECARPATKRVALRPDTRWQRGRLKSISLLGGVLAAMEAAELDAEDALMVRDGLVTEGTATNVFISTGGRIVTPSLESAPMLAGVTRQLILGEDPSIEERAVRVEELRGVQEIMLVGTKTMVSSVVLLDGRPVGDAADRGFGPGPASQRLLDILLRAIEHDIRTGAASGRPLVSHG